MSANHKLVKKLPEEFTPPNAGECQRLGVGKRIVKNFSTGNTPGGKMRVAGGMGFPAGE